MTCKTLAFGSASSVTEASAAPARPAAVFVMKAVPAVANATVGVEEESIVRAATAGTAIVMAAAVVSVVAVVVTIHLLSSCWVSWSFWRYA